MLQFFVLWVKIITLKTSYAFVPKTRKCKIIEELSYKLDYFQEKMINQIVLSPDSTSVGHSENTK